MVSTSWLARTRQTWKLAVFSLLIAVTLVLIVAFVLAVNGYLGSGVWGKFKLAVAFVLVGMSSLVWLCIAIRCPKCGKRPVWGMLRTIDANVWLVSLLAIDRCPSCKQ